jgi:PEP-CTERM motif
MSQSLSTRVALAALATLLSTSTLAQSQGLRGSLWITPDRPNDFGSFNKTVRSFALPVYFAGIAGGSDGSEGSASASVDYGVIKLGGHLSGNGTTQALGQFRDVLTFDVPGQDTGAPIDITFEVVVRGTLQAGAIAGIGTSQWTLTAVLGSNSMRASGALDSGSGDRSGFGTFRATARVPNGFAQQLEVTLEGAAYAVTGAGRPPSWATFDLGNSLYWGGITRVEAGGVEVGSYALRSQTGTDYRFSMVPVPEPSTWLMLAGGLALLGWRRLRASLEAGFAGLGRATS